MFPPQKRSIFPPLIGPKSIVQVLTPSGVLMTRIEDWTVLAGRTEPEYTVSRLAEDKPWIRREVKRLVECEGYKLLDLTGRIQTLSDQSASQTPDETRPVNRESNETPV
jgi:hypothetical protein